MAKLLGLIAVVTVASVLVINAAYMLISPRAWFRLPKWICLKGTLTEKRYGDGWGADQVRLLGLIILLVIGWLIYDLIVKH